MKRIRMGALLVAAGLAAAGVPDALAQRIEPMPQELDGVGIDDRLGAVVPRDIELIDEDGKPVRLAQFLSPGRPVLLNLGYYECPMLCGLVLNGLLTGLEGVSWLPGREFEIVNVSINPLETPALARRKKANVLEAYGRAGAGAGWHYLTGREDEVRRLADAVGFHYRFIPERHEYAHAAGLFFLSPDGVLARVLCGVQFEPRSLKLALAEASEGKVGGAAERFLLYCFHYDSNARRYVLAARNVMRAGGAGTALIVGVWLLTWWRRDARRTGRVQQR